MSVLLTGELAGIDAKATGGGYLFMTVDRKNVTFVYVLVKVVWRLFVALMCCLRHSILFVVGTRGGVLYRDN